MSSKDGVCIVCGVKTPSIDFSLGDSPIFITLKRCFDCSEKAEKDSRIRDKRDRVSASLMASGLPAQIVKVLRSDYELTKGQKKATAKISNKVWAMPYPYFYGPIGTGKTFCSCKIIYDYITETGNRARFVSIANIIDPKYHNVKKDPTEDQHPLVLDDLGNHTINQKIVSFLFNLINYRINNNLPTIITCNTDPITLGERLVKAVGEAESFLVESLCDRLLELCLPIKVEGKSIRTQRFLAANG